MMNSRTLFRMTPSLLAGFLFTFALQAAEFTNVTCEGTYPHHLQGVCTGTDAIYWCFTTTLVKTDQSGKLLKRIPVVNHHGDLCLHEGRLFVAVNLGRFNDPLGKADSWVYVYNASDLSFVSKHEIQEVVYGAGGIAVRNGHFFVVGGLPDGVQENYVYEYDEKLQYRGRHVISSGHTHLGIQTATFANDRWWFGCYGDPQILLVTDADFRPLGRYNFNCSLGIVGIPGGQFLVGSGRCERDLCTGTVRLAVTDEKLGLRIPEESQVPK